MKVRLNLKNRELEISSGRVTAHPVSMAEAWELGRQAGKEGIEANRNPYFVATVSLPHMPTVCQNREEIDKLYGEHSEYKLTPASLCVACQLRRSKTLVDGFHYCSECCPCIKCCQKKSSPVK